MLSRLLLTTCISLGLSTNPPQKKKKKSKKEAYFTFHLRTTFDFVVPNERENNQTKKVSANKPNLRYVCRLRAVICVEV